MKMKSTTEKAACPATHLLTLLSKRHMLLLLHTLTGESLGFNSLQEKLAINSASLSRRLKELEGEKIIERTPCPNDSRFHYYQLTKRGKKISSLIDQFQ
jgi:DNA-binding HxlR family transcriptional regulator